MKTLLFGGREVLDGEIVETDFTNHREVVIKIKGGEIFSISPSAIARVGIVALAKELARGNKPASTKKIRRRIEDRLRKQGGAALIVGIANLLDISLIDNEREEKADLEDHIVQASLRLQS